MKSLMKTLPLITACVSRVFAAPDVILADFESSGYEPWAVTGQAFGSGPAQGALPHQMVVDGFLGGGFANSYHGGDDSTGALVSPEFTVDRRYLSFLIGGGKKPERLALQLLVDGKVVRSATGSNERPGGSERLERESWDLSAFAGRRAVLRIIDEAKGGWGHITVDHIVQTDVRPKGNMVDVERTFPATTRYLNLPIRNGAPLRKVTLLADGVPVVSNDIELADGAADWWAPMDIGFWRGKTLTLRVDKLHEDSQALAMVEPGDTIKGAEDLYAEPLRGQFHFSPKRGWLNDPNGMVHYQGEYHLFFQHNPYGWGWGNMHWGHAVSRDLVHWEELGVKLLPDDMGPMYSGGAVVDWNNTSGLGRDGKPPMVIFYTAAGDPTVQCMAHSSDGRNFTKYEGNPILREITPGNRDPKVVWHGPSRQWVMVLWVEVEGGNTMQFFTSPDLKQWTYQSRTDGFYECPEFFEAALDGEETNRKWVLIGASSEYRIGRFDGKTFTPETPMLPGQRGRDFYAAQAFSDTPDGRNILIGWWRTETKGMPFNQSMSMPLDLRLKSTPAGPRLSFAPVEELKVLRAESHVLGDLILKPGDPNPLAAVRAELVELRATLEPGDANEIAFTMRGARIAYDSGRQEIEVEGHRAPALLRDGKVDLVVYLDRTGVEAFADGGLTFVPVPRNADAQDLDLAIEVRGGTARIKGLEVHELRSIWR